jgi:hypothetical protein
VCWTIYLARECTRDAVFGFVGKTATIDQIDVTSIMASLFIKRMMSHSPVGR